MKPHRLFKAPPHAVSFDRVAVFFGDCEADAGFAFFFLAVQDLEKEERAAALFAFADCKKLRAAQEPPDNLFVFFGLQVARHLLSGNSGLRPKDACGRVRGEQR
ncbi:hypothetical protein J2X71_000815 [Rhizobium sp. 1399]|jgi:hypothetical protein|nr:hypothetical protein [Rhizobium sp. 1399]